MVSFFKDAGQPKSVAIVYENTNFGQANGAAMKKAATDAKIPIVADESYTAVRLLQSLTLRFRPLRTAESPGREIASADGRRNSHIPPPGSARYPREKALLTAPS